MLKDLHYATRNLLRRPLVTGVAVLSLALGIGVNTAIFSVFDRLLLRRLPVPDPHAIVNVTSPGPRPGSASTSAAGPREALFSAPLFRDLARVQSPFSGIAGHRDTGFNLAHRGQTLAAAGELVSGNYFPTLGLSAAHGRLLGPQDDQRGDVVVLSHAYWMRWFAADPSVVGDTLAVNGLPMTIVGVAPPGFEGTTTMQRASVFVPLANAGRLRSASSLEDRRDHWVYVFARLERGVTRAQAEASLAPAFSALLRDVESGLADGGAQERAAFLARTIVLQDGSRGGDGARAETQVLFSLLFLVTGLVLTIACANVANLLLARAADRSAEVAVRLSLGASAGRILRLLLVEACLLGLAGGGAALAVASLTARSILTMMPLDDPTLLAFELDRSVLLFAGAMGVATGLLFGIAPAMHAVRTSRTTLISGQAGRTAGSRAAARWRTSLATAQVALATALLAQAGLFITSLANVTRVDLGIQRDGLMTFRVGPGLNGYTGPRLREFFEQVEDRIAGLPGVISVSASTIPLLSNGGARNRMSVEGFVAREDADVTARYTHVGPGYFATLGVPLIAGREFTRRDTGPAPTIAIVNEAFARKFRLGRDAVGKRIGLGRNQQPDIEIVGLVADAAYSTVREPVTPQFFLPYRQSQAGTLTFYVRSTAGSSALFPALVGVVKGLDSSLPVDNMRTMAEQIENNSTGYRLVTALSSGFAGLATLLAGVGLYGVIAYGVTQRLREFGIRIALGARTVDVSRLVLSQVARLLLVGGGIGVAMAFGLARLSRAMLFGVDGLNPAAGAGALVVLGAVACAAALLPVRRAARVDPAGALRAE